VVVPRSFSTLMIVMLVLKLAGVIGWSWWVVLFPLWIPAAILLPFVLYYFWSAGIDRLSEWAAECRIRRRHAGDRPELWL
jgi:hypothetical protein